MKTLSLKLDDAVFQETEKVLAKLKKPRNRYINEALQYYTFSGSSPDSTFSGSSPDSTF
jgi:metal-responsive CopG/Arc/MetJ family transcriptional regulator